MLYWGHNFGERWKKLWKNLEKKVYNHIIFLWFLFVNEPPQSPQGPMFSFCKVMIPKRIPHYDGMCKYWRTKAKRHIGIKTYLKGNPYFHLITLNLRVLQQLYITAFHHYYFSTFCQNCMNEADCIKKSLHKVFQPIVTWCIHS